MFVGNTGQILIRIGGDLSSFNLTMKEYQAKLEQAKQYSISYDSAIAQSRERANQLQMSSDAKAAEANSINTAQFAKDIAEKKNALISLKAKQDELIADQAIAFERTKGYDAETVKRNRIEVRLLKEAIALRREQMEIEAEKHKKEVNGILAETTALKELNRQLADNRRQMVDDLMKENPGMSRAQAARRLRKLDTGYQSMQDTIVLNNRQINMNDMVVSNLKSSFAIDSGNELQHIKEIHAQIDFLKAQADGASLMLTEKKQALVQANAMVKLNSDQIKTLETEIKQLEKEILRLNKRRTTLIEQSTKESANAALAQAAANNREASVAANAEATKAMAERRLQYGIQYKNSAYGLMANTALMGGGIIAGGLTSLALKGSEYQREVLATLHNTSIAVSGYKDVEKAIEDLALKTGVPIQKLITSFKDIENYGFSGANSIKILAESIKASVSMGSPIEATAELTAQLMTTYNMSISEASKAVSYLSTVAKMSKGDLKDLVGVMGPVMANAKTHGVTLQDLGAAYITLTRNSVGAAQAINQIKTSIMKLTDPSKGTETFIKNLDKITGRNLADAMTSSGMKKIGYIGVLQEIYDTIQKLISLGKIDEASGVIDRIMPNMRGNTAVTVFIDKLKGLLEVKRELAQSAGTEEENNKKYQDMLDLSATKVDQLKNQFVIFSKDVAETFAPTIKLVIENLKKLMDTFATSGMANLLLSGSGMLLFAGATGKLVIGLNAMAAALKEISLVSFIGSLGTATLTMAAVAGGIYLLREAYLSLIRTRSDEIEEQKKKLEANIVENKDAIELISAYDKLSASKNKTAIDSKELQKILDKIAERHPEYISSYDSLGHAIGLVGGAYETATKEAVAFQQKMEQIRKESLDAKKEALIDKRNALLQEVETINSLKRITRDNSDTLGAGMGAIEIKDYNEHLDQQIRKRASLLQEIEKINKQISDNARVIQNRSIPEADKSAVSTTNNGKIGADDASHRTFLEAMETKAKKARAVRDKLLHEANTMTETIKRKYAEAYQEFFGGTKLDGDYQKMIENNPIFAARKKTLDLIVQATDKLKALIAFNTHFSTIENHVNDLIAEGNTNIKDYIALREKLSRLNPQELIMSMFGIPVHVTRNAEKVDQVLTRIHSRITDIQQLHFDKALASIFTEINAPLEKTKSIFDQTMDKINSDFDLFYNLEEDEKIALASIAQLNHDNVEQKKIAAEATKIYSEEISKLLIQQKLLTEELSSGIPVAKQWWHELLGEAKTKFDNVGWLGKISMLIIASQNAELQKQIELSKQKKSIDEEIANLSVKSASNMLKTQRPDLAYAEDFYANIKKSREKAFEVTPQNTYEDIDKLIRRIKESGLNSYWAETKEKFSSSLIEFHKLAGSIEFTMATWNSMTKQQKKEWNDLGIKLDIRQQISEIMQGLQQITMQALNDLRRNGFKNFFTDILRMFDDMLFQMAAKWLAQRAMMQLTNLISSAISSGSGSNVSVGTESTSSPGSVVNVPTGRAVHVNMTVNTPNADSFRLSSNQAAADLMAAIRLAGARA